MAASVMGEIEQERGDRPSDGRSRPHRGKRDLPAIGALVVGVGDPPRQRSEFVVEFVDQHQLDPRLAIDVVIMSALAPIISSSCPSLMAWRVKKFEPRKYDAARTCCA